VEIPGAGGAMTAAIRVRALDRRDEGDLQREVWQLLKLAGCKSYWLSQVRKTQQTKGVADILTFSPRRGQAWIECKHPRSRSSKQRPEQLEFQQWCHRSGVTYLLVRDAQTVADWLSGRAV